MLRSLTILLAFQLAGEALAALFHWPLPGPVLGMLLLFTTLLVLRRVSAGLTEDTQHLLRYLPLILIPPSVGIMDHWGLLRSEAWAVGTTIVVTTTVSLIISAALMKLLARRA